MSPLQALKFVHLLAAATWTGGLITLALLVPVMRRAGASLEVLRAAARRFSHMTWTALAILLVTGVGQVQLGYWTWDSPALQRKLSLVALASGVAAFHQVTARRFGPAVSGVLQAAIGLASIAVFAAAVLL